MSVGSAATACGVSPSTLYTAIKTDRLDDVMRIAQHMYVKLSDVKAYVKTLKPYGDKRRDS